MCEYVETVRKEAVQDVIVKLLHRGEITADVAMYHLGIPEEELSLLLYGYDCKRRIAELRGDI